MDKINTRFKKALPGAGNKQNISAKISSLVGQRVVLEQDIAKELGISAAYFSLFKSGKRVLNPLNPRHKVILKKLKKYAA